MPYKRTGTLSQRLAALNFLQSVCTKTPDGYCAYQGSWSDKKVARHLKTVTPRVISELRREFIGKERSAVDRWHRHVNKVAAQMANAPQAITSMPTTAVAEASLHRLAQLEDRLQRLENMLGVAIGGRNDTAQRH